MSYERLQKYIANCGVTSRRKAEEMILDGKVTVNDELVNELGFKVDTEKDSVCVNGKKIKPVEKLLYIKLNKPTGYVTTVKDQFDRKCVIDLIDIPDRIYPIGRLDYDTSGLLLLTNDGDLANKLMHPRYKVYKTYIAKVKGRLNATDVGWLRHGIKIEEYTTSPAIVDILNSDGVITKVRISIYEGKNRQVRKMLAAVGKEVISLKRISFGSIELKDLTIGTWNYLSDEEIKYLKSL
ncbi:rRNA pseudouridine synthase [Sedimentibacter sp. zth1]|uniref:pseudouridine synthase n=1 Tax=Sedimentibacter sp. zth1 TaxID=2816908 RepID=UPI001A91D08C|nr:pseudouridine synthase [Sedimentibacter sp. zth1]QSX06795.1 rRNA pseudouridine synthase [Sedimentibacter sp. zth1]